MNTTPHHPARRATSRLLASVLTTALALGLLGAAVLGARPAQDRTAPVAAAKRLVVVQQNTDESRTAFRAAIARARAAKADVITLQEVCKPWVKGLAKKNGWTVSYAGVRTDKCKVKGKTHSKGVVTIVTQRGQTKSSVPLTLDNGRKPKLACVSFTFKGAPAHACSTHLVANAQYVSGESPDNPAHVAAAKARAKERRLAQATEVANATNAWRSAKQLVVVGGDFNTTPKTPPMAPLYATFREAHQIATGTTAKGGVSTVGKGSRKIDYLFFSKNKVKKGKRGTLQVKDVAGAGHHTMIAKVSTK